MNSMKLTKKALISSTLALILCFGMLLGTTYAWFTDSVTSSGNIIQSGTLDVTLEYKTPTDTTWQDASAGPIFNNTHWEPGYTELRQIKVENNGTLDLRYVLTIVPNQKPVDGEVNLADVIDVYMFDEGTTVDRAAIAAATPVGTVSDLIANINGAANGTLYADATRGAKFVVYTIVLKMRETAGNEYQGLSVGGGFSVNLLATQVESETDAFGPDYDAEATLPVVGSGAANVDDVDPLTGKLTVKITNTDTTVANPVVNYGTLVVDAASLAPGAEKVVATVEQVSSYQGNIAIVDGEEIVTYEIKVEGLVDGNTTPVKVYLYVGEGLNIQGLYHYDTEIVDYTYNDGTNGNIIFDTNTFSPFSIVVSDEPVPEVPEEELVHATVTTIPNPNDIAYNWMMAGQVWENIQLVGADQKLDAAYIFQAPHTAENVVGTKYAGWYCDYFVKVSTDVEAGGIILGGQYATFGDSWVGFASPTAVDAEYYVPLISFFFGPWTYEDVVKNVNTFQCGVADVDGKLAAANATFTVELRLINPELVNTSTDGWWENIVEGVHYEVANTVVYDFASGNSTVDGTTVVTTGEGLQDAVDNGSTDIQLGGDIDLSQGLVIGGN